ncbi:RTA1-domain-containing protein [Aulographum hederae CBS 113979]|uniref:RTA1-domain-containing protein n=1 Tax=Aulographum hederae CBS 113979 TaxID=1176131 RepID=A0A6G1H1W6_9PEZI|nr:RTA1-domain-containing protein [Aulographum hederae CBS 113979]
MSDDSSPHGTFVFYHYTPSLPAAIILTIVFILLTSYHLTLLLRKKTYYFIPFILGGLFEAIGYIGRALSSRDKDALGPYIMQTLLLLVAPALFAASVYMTLGRIILAVEGEERSLVRRKWLTKIFVAGDVLSFLMQSAGGGMMAKADSPTSASTGQNVIVGGLVVQVLFFAFFILVAIVFHRRLLLSPTRLSTTPSLPWQKHLIALYGISTLILIRSIFRIVEYVQGNDGYLLRSEVFLYVFDACLMVGVMVWSAVVYPAEITGVAKKNGGYGEVVVMEEGMGYRGHSGMVAVAGEERK